MSKLIYENDIPDSDDYLVRVMRKDSKRIHDKCRWKPNGITNNIEEWEQKNNIFQNITGCYTHKDTHEFMKSDKEECLERAKLAHELHEEAKESFIP